MIWLIFVNHDGSRIFHFLFARLELLKLWFNSLDRKFKGTWYGSFWIYFNPPTVPSRSIPANHKTSYMSLKVYIKCEGNMYNFFADDFIDRNPPTLI